MTTYKTSERFPDYFVSTDGEVYSLRKRKTIRPRPNHGGYLLVTLYRDGKRHDVQLHRLVLETHGDPCPVGHQCRHLDGNRTNNRIENLAWGTSKENHADRVKHGTDPIGSRNNRAKLDESSVAEIRRRYRNGGVTQQTLANEFGVNQTMIGFIVRGANWKHVDY